YTALQFPNGDPVSPGGINNQGVIVGGHRLSSTTSEAVIYRNGAVTTFSLAGETSTAFSDINDSGDIIGNSSKFVGPNQVFTPFLYRNGVVTLLPTIPGGPFTNTIVIRINNRGEILGTFNIQRPPNDTVFPNGFVNRGFILRN